MGERQWCPSMTLDLDPQKAVDFLRDHATLIAKAKAERIYLEQFLKSKRALLMRESSGGSGAAQEVAALAHPDYVQLVEALRDATEEEERMRWLMVAAQARIEVWRTMSANERRLDGAAR